jgi:hypothetical protein
LTKSPPPSQTDQAISIRPVRRDWRNPDDYAFIDELVRAPRQAPPNMSEGAAWELRHPERHWEERQARLAWELLRRHVEYREDYDLWLKLQDQAERAVSEEEMSADIRASHALSELLIKKWKIAPATGLPNPYNDIGDGEFILFDINPPLHPLEVHELFINGERKPTLGLFKPRFNSYITVRLYFDSPLERQFAEVAERCRRYEKNMVNFYRHKISYFRPRTVIM